MSGVGVRARLLDRQAAVAVGQGLGGPPEPLPGPGGVGHLPGGVEGDGVAGDSSAPPERSSSPLRSTTPPAAPAPTSSPTTTWETRSRAAQPPSPHSTASRVSPSPQARLRRRRDPPVTRAQIVTPPGEMTPSQRNHPPQTIRKTRTRSCDARCQPHQPKAFPSVTSSRLPA